MKRILAILLVLSAAFPAAAQQMLIEKEGSSNEIISLGSLKQITFSGTTVIVEQADGTTSQNEMSAISRISFGDYTAIDDTAADSSRLVTCIPGDAIAVNCHAGTLVTIYNVTGSQVLCTRLRASNAVISIAALPKGIYIIKANDRTAKIIRR